MKNSKNKIIASVICGMVIGSVGTSLVGNFQSSEKQALYSNNENNENSVDKSNNSSLNQDSVNDEAYQKHDQFGKAPANGKGRGNHHKGAASLDNTESIDITNGTYNDGIYNGTADGYSQNLKVQVEISDGKISDIEIVSHNETPGFYEKAFESVPDAIIKKQSTAVDTVSGATYSSLGIINAVNNALNSAKA